MTRKKLIRPLIDELRPPKGSPGPVPIVTPCPNCGVHMNQTKHTAHKPACKENSRKRPPKAADFMHDAGGGYNANLTFPQT